MTDIANLAFGLLLIGSIGFCVSTWFGALHRMVRGNPILKPAEPRVFTDTGISEIVLMVGSLIVVANLAMLAIEIAKPSPPPKAGESTVDSQSEAVIIEPLVDDLKPEALVPRILVNSIATSAAALMTLLWIRVRRFRFSTINIVPDFKSIAIGLIGAGMIIPPVMVLQAILIKIIAYNHPLLDVLQATLSWQVIVTMAISSTLIAPLVEEFFFRGLLQGWLEKVSVFGFGNGAIDSEAPLRRPAWWPMVVASFFFALVHASQGPAPITLFFLSLGIGYLYRQTGSIWPGIVVHMVLNGFSTAVAIFGTVTKT